MPFIWSVWATTRTAAGKRGYFARKCPLEKRGPLYGVVFCSLSAANAASARCSSSGVLMLMDSIG